MLLCSTNPCLAIYKPATESLYRVASMSKKAADSEDESIFSARCKEDEAESNFVADFDDADDELAPYPPLFQPSLPSIEPRLRNWIAARERERVATNRLSQERGNLTIQVGRQHKAAFCRFQQLGVFLVLLMSRMRRNNAAVSWN